MSKTHPQRVAVIGAGIVGIATALHLQDEGHDVTLIDPREPGMATSFGNAGAIVTGGVVPTATPGLLARVPKMMLDPMSALRIRWQYLPRLAPWLIRFLAAGRAGNAARISSEIATLTRQSLDAHHALAKRADAMHLIKPVGWLKVYRDREAFAGTAYDRSLMDSAGVRYDILDAGELRQLEPGLSDRFTIGLFQPESAFVDTPYDLSQAYCRAFVKSGGTVVRARVEALAFDADGCVTLIGDGVTLDADHVVIAAGAWSGRLARQLGHDVPLDTERGYHLNLARHDGPVLNRPTLIAGPQFVLCPMSDGIRLTSGVEFAGLDAGPDFRRIRKLIPLAQDALPGLSGEVTREWMGFRPSTPDSKPVIGRAPRHPNVYFAFGHGHMGLGLSAITGKLIAELIRGRDSSVPLEPFAIARF